VTGTVKRTITDRDRQSDPSSPPLPSQSVAKILAIVYIVLWTTRYLGFMKCENRYGFINHIRLFVRERLVHIYNDLLQTLKRMEETSALQTIAVISCFTF